MQLSRLARFAGGLPESTPVVRVGGMGVTGSGGLVQSPVAGSGLSVSLSKMRLSDLRRGKGSLQQRLVKSSKSTVHTIAPP
jgi:hypothetical protein